ncbi:PREDICTED: DNA-binding protein REB1 isoform X1 [Brassica oleracea var. oleracea]|uniref:Myb-like domain-containing protein n=1 Tax=Brassica oleracea var. oleracea TaxID=109376 RepID=A0A0D3C0C8_BRAOL|nr:PREDICTED: DNA-binding protein REB1 isoform X1 [Brassica oleracea var. oleracea]
MVMSANFFKLDSPESDTDEERTTRSKVAVQSQGTDAEHSSMKKKKKKASVEKPDSEDGGKKSKKKKKKKVSGGDEIGDTEKALVNTDDDDDGKRDTGKRKRVDDLGDAAHKPKTKKKKTIADSENSFSSANSSKKKSKAQVNNTDCTKDANQLQTEDLEADLNKSKKKRKKKQTDDPEAGLNTSTKDTKKKRKKKQTEVPEVGEDNKDSTEDAENTQTENSEADLKKSSKKKKQIDDPEVEEDNKTQIENSEAGLNKSTKVPKKKRKKKQIEAPEVEENQKDSSEDAENTQTGNSEAEGNYLNSPEIAKKKSKKKKKKKQSEDPEAEQNNKGKRKKKQKGSKSDEVLTTPSPKSAKKVNFSDQVEVFPAESEESDEEEKEEKVDLVRGKRFTEEEDELIKKSVLEYVDNHALGDEGINMVMNCKAHKQVRGCWKEIATALPWRPYTGVYYRAHTLFEEGSKGVWTKEDLELVVQHQKKRGNDWRTLADAMGKHRNHVKDAWRRIRLASKKRGHWSMEEYQSLFDLVNKDLRIKVFKEKHSKHGMLRDNIPWMAISDELGTRDHAVCCLKWYDQLTSPMVAKGIWANVDDYRLLDELTNLDAACVDDMDWDNILDNRDGDVCRSRWNQMVNHIGIPGSKTFAEQVEILSQRYCPDIAEDREDFDNRPFDPED